MLNSAYGLRCQFYEPTLFIYNLITSNKQKKKGPTVLFIRSIRLIIQSRKSLSSVAISHNVALCCSSQFHAVLSAALIAASVQVHIPRSITLSSFSPPQFTKDSLYKHKLPFLIAMGRRVVIKSSFQMTVNPKVTQDEQNLWTEPQGVTIHWKVVEQYITLVLFFFFNFPVFAFLQNLPILDLELSAPHLFDSSPL